MHDQLRRLRQDQPIWRDEKNDLVAILGHAEVIQAERRSDVFSSAGGYRSIVQEPGMELDMIALDDPEHNAHRGLVSAMFTPRAVRRLEETVQTIVTDLVDGFVGNGELEIVEELAAPLPARLTARLLGFDEEHAPQVRSWSERLMRIDQVQKDPQAMVGFMGAIMEFSAIVNPIADQRRQCPADDLISVWANSELHGCPVGPEVLVQETGLFISGGAETTRTVVARGLIELASHPQMWEAMAADPALIPSAVEELLRWVTPLNNFFRTTLAPIEVGGEKIDEGQRVILLYPSANRDERVFPDSYAFDIRRTPNPHVAFGFGTHFCLGSSLARLELRLVFSELVRRLTDLQLLGQPDIEPNVFVSAVRSCRLGFRAR